MKKIKENRNYIFALMLVMTFVFFFIVINNSSKVYVPYNEFMKSLSEGKVNEVTLSNGDSMWFKKENEKSRFYTENPRRENFKEELLLGGVAVKEKEETNASGIFGLLLFGGLGFAAFYFISKKKGGNKEMCMTCQESNIDESEAITFDTVAGNEEAKESLMDVIDFLKNPAKYKKYGARMPKGVIFYGPPGTGKTLMARALAGEAGVPFYATSGSDFVQMYVGVGASRIRDLFKKAKEKEKAVIFIDEIDALAKKRTNVRDGGNEERDQTLNALLTEMSGFKESDGIMVIAATNRLDVLDDAILRPGRFDRHIEIALPDKNARRKIIEVHSKNKPLKSDKLKDKLADETVYFSGASLENLLNEAAIIAAKENLEFIDERCLDKAFYIVVAGNEKKDRSFISKEDKELTAYHEAGHVIATKFLKPTNKISKVTIIPSTKGAGGYTLNIPKDKLYSTRRDILDEIKILLAGRCAEETIYGFENVTTGGANDFEKASELALNYISKYGMSKKYGVANVERDAKNILDDKVEILKKEYEETLKLIMDNRDKLDKLARELTQKETLDEDEINSIIA